MPIIEIMAMTIKNVNRSLVEELIKVKKINEFIRPEKGKNLKQSNELNTNTCSPQLEYYSKGSPILYT